MKKDIIQKDKEFDSEYFYSQINTHIEKTFTFEQKKEVKNLLKRIVKIPSKKLFDFNINFWFIKKLYLTFYLGIDKRTKDRIPSKFVRIMNYIFSVFFVLFILFAFGLFVFSFIYTVKSALGIDFFPGKHLSNIISTIIYFP